MAGTTQVGRGDAARTRMWARAAAAVALAVVSLGVVGVPDAAAADDGGYLRWHVRERRVDADLRDWPLGRVLERIAGASGWEVFVEPGIDLRVAARFEGRPVREALAALFSDINFAVLPARVTNGATRLLVFRSTTSDATQAVKASRAEGAADKALPKEMVVRLKKGSKADIAALAKKLGARVAGALPGQDAYRLVFDDEAAVAAARTALEGNEDVASVESNYAIGAPGQMERLGDMAAPNLNLRARPLKDGSSVVVALLDTGIQANTVAHPDFLLPGVTVASSSGTGESGLAHGPAMFETILQGLALGQTGSGSDGTPVRVLPIDLYGGRSETSTFELAQGVVAALERGADILNMSLSGPSPSPLVQDVLKQASQAGVLAFAAPGNEPTTASTYPAAYPEVMAVTAANRQGQLADYANRGGFVDLMAPGTSVVPYAGETWVVNGTSVATAYTSGLAAGLLADSGRTTTDIARQLQQKIGFQTGTAASKAGTGVPSTPAPAP